MRDLGQEVHHRQPGEHPVGAQQMQRAQRICALPAERRAPIRRQRFRQDQQAVKRVGKAQARRDPERQPRIHAAEQPADRRSENETGAERDTDLAEHRGALLGRRHIRDVGECRRNTCRGNARDHPADEKPGQGRRQRHQHIIEREPEIRQQHHRPPAEPVREAAEDRREEKLHHRPGGAEQTEDPRGARGIVVDKTFHELGQDRQDQTEREHVQEDGDEDEGHRSAAWRACRWRRDDARGRLVSHELRLWLRAEGRQRAQINARTAWIAMQGSPRGSGGSGPRAEREPTPDDFS